MCYVGGGREGMLTVCCFIWHHSKSHVFFFTPAIVPHCFPIPHPSLPHPSLPHPSLPHLSLPHPSLTQSLLPSLLLLTPPIPSFHPPKPRLHIHPSIPFSMLHFYYFLLKISSYFIYLLIHLVIFASMYLLVLVIRFIIFSLIRLLLF